MSQAPVWITESGSLGVVPEGKFYRISLQAEDPDFPGDPTKVTYKLIAGKLPEGVQVNTNGTIEGIPISVADFKGVPAEVSENTTSKFAIRATDDEDRVADRTFTLTVSGQDKPEWITEAGLIGRWFDGSEVEFQFEVTDLDPGDELEITLIAGELPPGSRPGCGVLPSARRVPARRGVPRSGRSSPTPQPPAPWAGPRRPPAAGPRGSRPPPAVRRPCRPRRCPAGG